MPDPHPVIRPAAPSDAPALATLVDIAGEGLPLYLWSRMAEPGEDPWEVGRRRALRESGGFSYRNAVVLERDGEVVACLIGYPLPDEPEPFDPAALPPLFVPLQELESLAPGTWYVNVLATDPAHRGRGYASRLLALADELASKTRRAGTSLIVSDANPAALRLYARHGYRRVAARAMVKEGWQGAGRDWLLLVRTLVASGPG